jgi:hypothetical protein
MKIFAHLLRVDRGGLALAAACAVLACLPARSIAVPLDKAACAKLAAEMQNMKALDIDKLMEKGPAWAASHLPPAELSLIRQYIDLDEQMRFRCAAPGSLVHLKHIEEDGEEASGANTQESAEADAKKDQSGDGEEEDAPAAPEKRKAAKTPKAKTRKGGSAPASR